ncbi:MAG: FAD-dependent oxidoreductase [Sphaerochaetaceae bacterium]|jgi:3-phenylpropionate/trans-cinnamate dioxygenase ferredoxin reductase subunit
MKTYTYIIIGGGLAADAAVRGIRERDKEGSICLISSENVEPYVRPNLTKGLWKGKEIKKIWCHTEDLGATLILGRKVTHLYPDQKRLLDDQGDEYSYEKLLLATGGDPIKLKFGESLIQYYRTLADYQKLRSLTDSKSSFLIIGGGFIGAELAASLKQNSKNVTMVFPEEAIGEKVYPKGLALYLNDYYRDKGVRVVAKETIVDVQQHGEHIVALSAKGEKFIADGVIAGIGIRPNITLAQEASIIISNGIDVDEYLQTSQKDIWAAGDVANFYHNMLEKRVRLEHEDNAVAMGKVAGRNMAGALEAYTYTPMFYSDLFELGYEAVGELDSRFEIVSDWSELYKKGIIYYLDNNQIKGILLWNVWDKVDDARSLLERKRTYLKDTIKGLL